jgi:uncharacterized protein YndB with AHSA1/START domain
MSSEPHGVEVDIDAAPEHVYDLLADVTRMGEWSSECVGCRWLGRAREARPGARFRGTSRNGWHRWSTTSTITVAEPGHAFAFAVSYLRLPVATWRYDLLADGRGGTVLAETVEDHRGALLRTVSPFITGSRNRSERNDATMRTTLDHLKAAAESGR